MNKGLEMQSEDTSATRDPLKEACLAKGVWVNSLGELVIKGPRQIDGTRQALFAARAGLWLHRLSGGRDRGAHQSQVSEFSKVFVRSA
jgi:hypothetical protein